jgi:hypothetical protein
VWQPTLDAAAAIDAGWREDMAQGFLPPDGILPRMRLLAWGWTKPGDKFKSPSDRAWWRQRYQYPLWNPLETYVQQLERTGVAPLSTFTIDEDLAAGNAALLSYALPAVVQGDLPPVNEAPCPKWLIPPGRGMMPIANPECAVKKLVDKFKNVPLVPTLPRLTPPSVPWWLIVGVIAVVVMAKGNRR